MRTADSMVQKGLCGVETGFVVNNIHMHVVSITCHQNFFEVIERFSRFSYIQCANVSHEPVERVMSGPVTYRLAVGILEIYRCELEGYSGTSRKENFESNAGPIHTNS